MKSFWGRVPAKQKIASFAELDVGWCYGSGGPITSQVRARAHDLVEDLLALGFTQLDALPVSTGEIQVLAYSGQHRLSAILSETLADFAYDAGEETRTEQEAITDKFTLLQLIRKASKEIWGMSGSSTQRTSRNSGTASATCAFVSRRMVGSQYSTPHALRPQVA